MIAFSLHFSIPKALIYDVKSTFERVNPQLPPDLGEVWKWTSSQKAGSIKARQETTLTTASYPSVNESEDPCHPLVVRRPGSRVYMVHRATPALLGHHVSFCSH